MGSWNDGNMGSWDDGNMGSWEYGHYKWAILRAL